MNFLEDKDIYLFLTEKIDEAKTEEEKAHYEELLQMYLSKMFDELCDVSDEDVLD